MVCAGRHLACCKTSEVELGPRRLDALTVAQPKPGGVRECIDDLTEFLVGVAVEFWQAAQQILHQWHEVGKMNTESLQELSQIHADDIVCERTLLKVLCSAQTALKRQVREQIAIYTRSVHRRTCGGTLSTYRSPVMRSTTAPERKKT